LIQGVGSDKAMNCRTVNFDSHRLPNGNDKQFECRQRLGREMTLDDRIVNLAKGGYDAAIVIEKRASPLVIARRLGPNLRSICATADYFRRHGIPNSPEDLTNHNCILFTPLGIERE